MRGRLPGRRLLDKQIPVGWLFATILGYLGFGQLALWRFLGLYPVWAYGTCVLAIAVLCIGVAGRGRTPTVDLRTLSIGLAVAMVLLVLGGEGRLFYSNVDWQVRDAVLRDMVVNPWPFVYTARASADVLRAPLGMFFAPALAGKAAGMAAADGALLVQNTAMLGMLLAAASILFEDARGTVVALAVFLAFSGLDIVGEALGGSFQQHMEGWAGVQFSSTVTLAFWVPQHAIAGWIGAVAYLLWRQGCLPLASYLALLPLTALWSPLSLIGSLPFAALAAVTTLRTRRLGASDMLMPAAATLIALPGLTYLGAADHEVGLRIYPIAVSHYLLFEAVETLPYIVPLALALPLMRSRGDWPTLFVATACLLVAPLIQIGGSVDFAMRASITALAVIAVLIARLMAAHDLGQLAPLRVWTLAALTIGAMTGAAEISRALSHPPSPRDRCSFFKAWDQSFADFPKGSYLAPLAEMPAIVRPHDPTRVSPIEPARCWDGKWYRPSGVLPLETRFTRS